ncbi:NACHT domain-containing protein [Streptomyces sp. NPDC059832]|uniref:NACHT domain-containing protein n=1 Tax=unclassified Streptomyces TaxID=2593676 RepID=UPI0036468278
MSGSGARQSGLEHPAMVTVSVEQALSGTDRLPLRGPAGSGKNTLVQWLAVNAARRTFGTDLMGWNRCVPFVLRLRAFTSHGTLPTPEEFLRAAGVPLHGSAPAGWANGLLASGRGLVLVDGVDEVPARLRRRTEKWLKDLVVAYPPAARTGAATGTAHADAAPSVRRARRRPLRPALLAGLDGLTIALGSETEATGTDLFPPERIVRLAQGAHTPTAPSNSPAP